MRMKQNNSAVFLSSIGEENFFIVVDCHSFAFQEKEKKYTKNKFDRMTYYIIIFFFFLGTFEK
jgi:hypothetical protein